MWKCITVYLRGLSVELIAISLAGLISIVTAIVMHQLVALTSEF